MQRAAIYGRVSTQAQETEGTSLTTQEAHCRAYAAAHGYTVVEEHVYQEVFTGTELWERPQLTKLRDVIRRQAVDVVIAYAIDRLARDPVHLGVILSEADHKGVSVAFVTEVLDDSPEGQLIRFVRGYAAKVEHEKIRERSIRGKRARAESGKLLAGVPELYGYRLDRERGVRVVEPYEASIVRRIFSWYVDEGLAMGEIARRLNAEQVPPMSAGKRTYADEQRVLHWGPNSVRNVLKHEAYAGDSYAWKWMKRPGSATHSKAVVQRPRHEWIPLPEGTTPALISRATFDAAQRQLEINRGEKARNQKRPMLLRGLIYCATCDRRMIVKQYHRNVMYYSCPSWEYTKHSCGNSAVQALPVEQWVWDQVTARLLNPALIEQEWRARRRQPADTGDDAELRLARKRINQIVTGQERLLARYSESDAVPWDLIEREIKRAEQEKAELRQHVANLEARRQQRDATHRQLKGLTDWCDRIAVNLDSMTFEERRRTLETLGVRVRANGFTYEPIQLDPSLF